MTKLQRKLGNRAYLGILLPLSLFFLSFQFGGACFGLLTLRITYDTYKAK